MPLPHKYILAITASVLGASFTFVASQYFDSSLPHGLVFADILFFILLLTLPKGNLLWNMPFVIVAALFAILSNSIDAYASAGIFIIIIVVCAMFPRKKSFLLPLFIIFTLFFLIADWANFFYSTFILTLTDVWGLAKFFWWGPTLFLAVPLLQILLEILFVRKILWGKNRLEMSYLRAYVIIAIVVGLNFGINKLQDKQPIMEYSVKKWMWQLCTPGVIGHNSYLQEDIKAVFPIWDKTTPVISTFSRPTVVILVESYGVNKSIAYTDSLLAPFKKVNFSFIGLFLRNAAHTQGAEWEDLDTPQGVNQDEALPHKFRTEGIQTWFLHGYDGNFYERDKNYAKFGFDSLLFKKDFLRHGLNSCHYGFEGICDSAIAGFMDSLLTDTCPKFIYWTTLDAHPPYEFAGTIEKSSVCNSLSLSNVDCTYFSLQQNTINHLLRLASKHPNYRFVIRGDHRPMGSLEQSRFVQSFYFRWVPLIILN